MSEKMNRRNFLTRAAALSSLPVIAGCTDKGEALLPSSISHAPDPGTAAGKNKSTSLMPMRKLGNTDMTVSVITHGCATQFLNLAEGEWQKSLDAALAGGINMFDFAAAYGTEPRAGTYFTPSLRSTVYLTTKLNSRDYAGAKAEFATSLSNMKTSYVDILFCHALDSTVTIDQLKTGAWKFLLECKQNGSARYIAFSSMSGAAISQQMLDPANDMAPDVALMALSAGVAGTDYPPADYIKNCLPLANASNVGVMAMKVLRGMTGTASPEELLAYVLNLKDSKGNYAVATMSLGFTFGATEVQTDIGLVQKILGSSGVLGAAYDFKSIERRASRVTTPETMCWMRDDYRDDGKEYVWA
jgi:aryl-alcohol dehydrogenase-like predicted oxidoreductase